MNCDDKRDHELTSLLDLDGRIFVLEDGYYVKIEANMRMITKQVPHGIKYNLTLHDRYNRRVLGFDNAHSVAKILNRPHRYKAKKITWDHKHKLRKIMDYEFESASQLQQDFWNEVYAFLDRND
jgi:hypothetical protein